MQPSDSSITPLAWGPIGGSVPNKADLCGSEAFVLCGHSLWLSVATTLVTPVLAQGQAGGKEGI